MAKTFWRLEDGELTEEQAKARTYILGKLVEILKAADSSLDARLSELVAKLEGRSA